MSLGPAEILVILLVALVVFGPARLPEVSRQIAGAMREIRKVQGTVRRELREVLDDDGTPPARPARRTGDEPDHADAAPPPEPVDRGFEGPSGSFQ